MSSTIGTLSGFLRDAPPVPFLTMGRREIAQRLFAKECLRRAFRWAGVRWWHSPLPPDSHGEFGIASGWDGESPIRSRVREWLEEAGEVEEIAAAVTAGVDSAVDPSKLISFARGALCRCVDEVTADEELAADGLAEQLAEGAVLPMFGMPSRVRVLYHQLNQRGTREVDRELDLAVTEFAPGSQKTKDKRVHQAIGFTAPLVRRGNEYVPTNQDPLASRQWMARCQRCHFVRTSQELPAEVVCPECGCSGEEYPAFRVFRIAVPLGFRTDLGRGVDAKEEAELLAVGAGSFVETQSDDCYPVEGTNCGAFFSSAGRVFRVNDRRGELYRGALGTVQRKNAGGKPLGRPLHHQWVDERFEQDAGNFAASGPPEEVALVLAEDYGHTAASALAGASWFVPRSGHARGRREGCVLLGGVRVACSCGRGAGHRPGRV